MSRERSETLIEQIDAAHEWTDERPRGGSGTQLTTTCRCRMCGLTRTYYSDRQNGIAGETTYGDMSLAEVARQGCA